jgi:hypothetical protein
MISIGGQVNHKTFQNRVLQSNSNLEEGSTPSEQHLQFQQRYAGDSPTSLGVRQTWDSPYRQAKRIYAE